MCTDAQCIRLCAASLLIITWRMYLGQVCPSHSEHINILDHFISVYLILNRLNNFSNVFGYLVTRDSEWNMIYLVTSEPTSSCLRLAFIYCYPRLLRPANSNSKIAGMCRHCMRKMSGMSVVQLMYRVPCQLSRL